MPTVDSTNSYVTEAEAATYFGERLYADNWTSATEANRQKALLMACKLLDGHVVWEGVKADEDQDLEWPRAGVADYEDDEIPPLVQEAQMELALVLLATDTTALPGDQGVAEEKLGPMETVYDKTDRLQVIPDRIMSMLAGLGRLKGLASSVTRTR